MNLKNMKKEELISLREDIDKAIKDCEAKEKAKYEEGQFLMVDASDRDLRSEGFEPEKVRGLSVEIVKYYRKGDKNSPEVRNIDDNFYFVRTTLNYDYTFDKENFYISERHLSPLQKHKYEIKTKVTKIDKGNPSGNYTILRKFYKKSDPFCYYDILDNDKQMFDTAREDEICIYFKKPTEKEYNKIVKKIQKEVKKINKVLKQDTPNLKHMYDIIGGPKSNQQTSRFDTRSLNGPYDLSRNKASGRFGR